ncbi:DUF7520 family protein [Halobaculum sp. D14]|uniref:DUF7520 family protein n=1 Tax=unclassified Halobaculum TaxID=2640896 RepID=UPI003EBEE870
MTDSEQADDARGRRGPRLVLVLYGALVSIAGVGGALIPVFVDDLSAPALFGVFALPVSPAGFAVYGAVTIAFVLGVPLALVVYVSHRVDDPDAVGRD